MISPAILENEIAYSSVLNRRMWVIYWTVIIMIVSSISILPFIYFDISVKASGILRPKDERTEVKSMLSGIIDTIFYKEGGQVEKGNVIFRLVNNTLLPRKLLNTYELACRAQFIHDLQLLTATTHISQPIIPDLQSPLYKQQISRFIYQMSEHQAAVRKVEMEMNIDNMLIKDRIISPKEHFDKKMEMVRLIAARNAFKDEQMSIWQEQLDRYKLEYSQLQTAQKQLCEEERRLEVRAPVSGFLLGIYSQYSGGFLQAGEAFCIISPETNLIAECYIPAQKMSFLKVNQMAKFRIDAFDYNQFGVIGGKVSSIDNDFTLIDNQPVFKVRCVLDSTKLSLKNGFSAVLKKGLTIQGRFVISRRSAWQLLFDTLDNWLDPTSTI
jgi:HlyD family secretion protein